MDAYPRDYERLVQEVYEAVLRPGDFAVDVGAHVGRHTIPMARCVAPEGQIFAFEPVLACRQQIESNLSGCSAELASVVTMRPEALAEKAGQAEFFVAEDALSYSSLRSYDLPTPVRRITVPIATLDGLFLDLPSLRYLKIDAEGADLRVLLGGRRVLEKFRPVVSFEFGTAANRQGKVAPGEVARFWTGLGYDLYAIDGRKLEEAKFVETARQERLWDFVAAPTEDAGLLEVVREALRRPRVNWLALRAWLGQAKAHAAVGAELPPLRRFRGPFWPAARLAARLMLTLARIVTGPQRAFNEAVVHCLHRLTEDLEEVEAESTRRARRLRGLEEKVDGLECELTRIRQVHQQTLEMLEEKLAGSRSDRSTSIY